MNRIALALAALLLTTAAWAQSSKYPFGNNQPVVNQAYSSAAITPSDTVKIQATRAIYNGNSTGCQITMKLNGDSAAQTYLNVQPGEILPVQAVLVMATGTSCSNLIAWY